MAVSITPVAVAQHDCRRGVDHRFGCAPEIRREHGGDGWVLPALIIGGLVVAAEANRQQQQTVIVERPVYVQPQSPVYLQPPPYGYKYIIAVDPACNCNKYVLVPIN